MCCPPLQQWEKATRGGNTYHIYMCDNDVKRFYFNHQRIGGLILFQHNFHPASRSDMQSFKSYLLFSRIWSKIFQCCQTSINISLGNNISILSVQLLTWLHYAVFSAVSYIFYHLLHFFCVAVVFAFRILLTGSLTLQLSERYVLSILTLYVTK